jgi:predicted GIY-YIG superfamily endonuclease
MMKKVYVIELDAGSSTSRRFYVGTSGDVEHRYEKHAKGEGCEYTRQYKPKYLVEVYEAGATERDALEMEDAVTEKYILAYGSGVRGGHYLNESDVLSVFKKDKHQRDLCYRCGEPGHYSNKCPILNTELNASTLIESIEEKTLRLSKIKVSLWSSGNSKYADSITLNSEIDPKKGEELRVDFGAQTHANNKNNKVQIGALFCDTSLGGWTVRGIVSKLEFDHEKNCFKLSISPIPETGVSIRSNMEQHGKVGIAKALGLPIPSYNWTSSGIVVHR